MSIVKIAASNASITRLMRLAENAISKDPKTKQRIMSLQKNRLFNYVDSAHSSPAISEIIAHKAAKASGLDLETRKRIARIGEHFKHPQTLNNILTETGKKAPERFTATIEAMQKGFTK